MPHALLVPSVAAVIPVLATRPVSQVSETYTSSGLIPHDCGLMNPGCDSGVCIFNEDLQEIPLQPFWEISHRNIIWKKHTTKTTHTRKQGFQFINMLPGIPFKWAITLTSKRWSLCNNEVNYLLVS